MKQMKKPLLLLCAAILIVTAFGFVACNDNQDNDNDNNGTTVLGQQVSEEVWNEQIENIISLSNFTFSLISDNDYFERKEPYIMKFANNISYLSDDNGSNANERYCIWGNTTIIEYVRKHGSNDAWQKYEYTIDDKFDYQSVCEYFSNWIGPSPILVKEALQQFNRSDFIFDKETGIYKLEYKNITISEIKFLDNQIIYLKQYLDWNSNGLLYGILDHIGTTEIDLHEIN